MRCTVGATTDFFHDVCNHFSVFLSKVMIKRGRMGTFNTRGVYFWHLFVWRESSQPFLAVPKGAKRRSNRITLNKSPTIDGLIFTSISSNAGLMYCFIFCFEVHNQPTVHLYSVVDRDRLRPVVFGTWASLKRSQQEELRRILEKGRWASIQTSSQQRHDTTSLTLKAKMIAGGCFDFFFPCCCIAMQGQLSFRLKGSDFTREAFPTF